MIFITIVVFVAVGLLTGTGLITRDQIEYQKQLKIDDMLGNMFPEMSDYILDDEIYTLYENSTVVGYAFLAVGKGYGGNIDILIGLEDKETIKGITIISHLETPGVGARITESAFTGEFTGVKIDDVALKKNDGEIDGITGATISSTAVVNAVKATALEKIKALKERQ
ncbi:FMN-binding protein [Chloroflexota bacterium]